MKFRHILEAVYSEPWHITADGWRSIHAIVKPYAIGEKLLEPKSGFFDDDGKDAFQQPLPAMEITMDGVAIIPIKGPLIQHAGLIEKKCGAVSYQDICSDLESAFDDGIRRAMLDIDSPGGQCNGCYETADYILELRERGMRIDAFSDGRVASAAYNLAASCETLAISQSAQAGCVGTLMAVIDCSEEFSQAGLTLELFAVGKFKGAGMDGLKMNDDHRSYFQGLVHKYGDMFKDNVRENRAVSEDSMQGHVMIGSDAVDAGLADRIVADIDEAVEEAQ